MPERPVYNPCPDKRKYDKTINFACGRQTNAPTLNVWRFSVDAVNRCRVLDRFRVLEPQGGLQRDFLNDPGFDDP